MFTLLNSRTRSRQLFVLILAAAMFGGLSPFSRRPLTHQVQRQAQPLIASPAMNTVKPSYNSSTKEQPNSVEMANRARADVYQKSALAFEPVKDETGFGPQFITRGVGYNVAFSPDKATISLRQPAEENHHNSTPSTNESRASELKRAVVSVHPLRANKSARLDAIDELAGKVNYFLGPDPSGWRTNVPTFAKVKYADLYAGVDMIYYGNQQQLEYDFVVAPGTHPGIISLAFDGVDKVSLDAGGDLILHVAGSEIRHKRPVAYQETGAARQEVNASYVLRNENEVLFQVDRYDVTKPLIIDPVLIFSSFLGGAGAETGYGIATDAAGNCLITGFTNSLDLPTAAPIDSSFGGTNDVFLTRLNPAGEVLSSTYLGGSGNDQGQDVIVDSAGNIFVGGFTSGNFPVLNGVQPNFGGGGLDCFIVKLDPTASVLLWGTYLGGSRDEAVLGTDSLGLALDQAGNLFATGRTNSTNFPVVSALQPTNHGNFDVFLSKIRNDGTALIFSTYLGGTGEDGGFGVAVNSLGEAYVTGVTFSANFPTVNALDNSLAGAFDAFVFKVAANGASLAFATYLGGNDQENGFGGDIAVDDQGFAYVTGSTGSTDFVTVNPIQGTNHGSHDIFITKINPSGTAIIYSTLFGSSGTDAGLGIKLDQSGNVWVVGFSSGPDFPAVNALDSSRGGSSDAVLVKINSTGTAALLSTYYGGNAQETGNAIALDQSGSAVITGVTTSTDLSIARAFQPLLRGPFDAFVAKIFDAQSLSISSIASNRGGNNGTVSAAILGAGFQDGAIVKLTRTGLPDISDAQPVVIDSSRISATFDLRLAAPGRRDVVVINPGGATATLADGFNIEEGGTARVWADIIGRSSIRDNTAQIYTVVYGNSGNINAPAPLLELSSPDPVQFTLSNNQPFQNGPVRIFAGGQGGPAGVLPPGSFSMQVSVITPLSRGRINLDLSVIETQGQNFDWNLVANQGAPAGADLTDWQERVNLAHSRIGNSLEDVMNALRTRANESTGDVSGFYNFDEFARYAIGAYGAAETQEPIASKTKNKTLVRASHHAKRHSSGASAQTDVAPSLITVSEHANPTETIVIFHGGGGLFGLDGHRTDFINAAAALAAARPGANIYVFDWTSQAQERLSGNTINPWAIAPHIDAAGKAAYALMRGKQAQGFLNPAKTTTIGESFGGMVMDVAAANFVANGFGKLQHGLALGTPPATAGHSAPAYRQHYDHSENVMTPSPFDSKGKDADFTLFYQTTKHKPDLQHTDPIKALIANPDFFLNLPNNPSLFKSLIPFVSDGSITTVPSYVSTPYFFLFDLPLPLEFLARQLFRSLPVSVLNSHDPNDKTGTLGAGDFHYLSGSEPLRYLVSIENVATATAPAQTVVIREQLDVVNDDLNTVTLGPINFGSHHLVPPPGVSEYIGSVDLRPNANLIVKVEVALNKQSGLLTWTFKSLDPSTGLPVDDPTAGFLPPNTSPPQGEGSVFFTVSPKSVPTGTQISNQASVVFDNNAAILTGVWSNRIDVSKPTSHVVTASATPCSPSIAVAWTGSDEGAGVKSYSIYASDNGGAFQLWQKNTTATSGNYAGEFGHAYAFFSIAEDLAGNVEEKNGPDVGVTTNPPPPPSFTSVPPAVVGYTGAGGNSCNVLMSDAALGTATVASDCQVTIARSGVPSGNLFPIGNTTITYNATDALGRTASATQLVTIIDNTPPTLTTPATINAPTGSTCRTAIPDLIQQSSFSDNCASAVTFTQNPSVGTLVGPGTYAISLTATDTSGNRTTRITNLIVNGVPNFTISITPTVVKRGGLVTVTTSFRNCSSTRQTVTLKLSLTTPRSNSLMLTLPALLQPNQQGSLSIPLLIPKQTATGLYSLTVDYFVSGAQIGRTTAQLTVTN